MSSKINFFYNCKYRVILLWAIFASILIFLVRVYFSRGSFLSQSLFGLQYSYGGDFISCLIWIGSGVIQDGAAFYPPAAQPWFYFFSHLYPLEVGASYYMTNHLMFSYNLFLMISLVPCVIIFLIVTKATY